MALIDDALDFLQVTWDDPVLKRKLTGAMNRGKVLINEYAGSAQDFEQPGTAQGLLFEYMRYVRSDATEMFEKNYLHDLLRLRRLNMADMLLGEEDADD